MSTSRLPSEEDSTVEVTLDLQDTTTGVLYRNISSDGELPIARQHGLETYIDIRPTADVPATSLTKLQIAMMIARFMIGANTATMSPPKMLPQPFASAWNWGFMHIGIEVGTGAFKGASRHWLDSLNILRNDGDGNAALGLVIDAARVVVACIPSALVGLGVGMLPLGVLSTAPLASIIAALISPWIYIAAKKLIDYYFPQPQYQCNPTPPLHDLQYAAMFSFSVFDAVNIYEFIRVLIKEYGPEELVRDPHFGAGVIILYLLLSDIFDPLAFGHSKLYGPGPFDAPLTHEELGIVETPEPLLVNEDEIASDLEAQVQTAINNNTQAEVTDAKLKNAAVYAAIAVLAMGAGLIADLASAKLLGDTTKVSNTVRKLGVAFICTCTAATQVALVNNAPKIIETAKNCWTSFFHRQPEPVQLSESLMADIEREFRPPPPSFRPPAPFFRPPPPNFIPQLPEQLLPSLHSNI